MSAEQVTAWREERRRIVNSLEFGYAMGHGCTYGGKTPEQKQLVARKLDLDALIREHDGR